LGPLQDGVTAPVVGRRDDLAVGLDPAGVRAGEVLLKFAHVFGVDFDVGAGVRQTGGWHHLSGDQMLGRQVDHVDYVAGQPDEFGDPVLGELVAGRVDDAQDGVVQHE
jgi:hypothetical protein